MASWILLIPLLPIVFEDFRHRAIHWAWIALLLFLAYLSLPINWHFVSVNICFLVLQLGLLFLYFSVKEKKWTNITKNYLGIGDIVFFLPLCFIFSPINLIAFIVISLLLSIIGSSIYSLFIKGLETVPLAGCMAMALIAILPVGEYFDVNFLDDSIILSSLHSTFQNIAL